METKSIRKPKTKLQVIALSLGMFSLAFYFLIPFALMVSYDSKLRMVLFLLVLLHPVIAILYYKFARLKIAWLGLVFLILGLNLADWYQVRMQHDSYCSDLKSRCTQVSMGSWHCPDPTPEEPDNIYRVIGPNCGPYIENKSLGGAPSMAPQKPEIDMSDVVAKTTIRKQNQQIVVTDAAELEARQPTPRQNKDSSEETYTEQNTILEVDNQIIHQNLLTEWQLEGILSLPHGKIAKHDIKLRVWTWSGASGKGHSQLWPIYKGENSTSFMVIVNGPAPQGYKLHYTCEQGCEGIVDAYYQTYGSVYDRSHAYTLNDGYNYTNIEFPILLGDTISGQIHLSSGHAEMDMLFNVYVDDVRRNIGRVKNLRILLPRGTNHTLFSMGLPTSSNNQWRFGISCDSGCESYLSDGYIYPNGLVQNHYESEIFNGGKNQRVNFIINPKP